MDQRVSLHHFRQPISATLMDYRTKIDRIFSEVLENGDLDHQEHQCDKLHVCGDRGAGSSHCGVAAYSPHLPSVPKFGFSPNMSINNNAPRRCNGTMDQPVDSLLQLDDDITSVWGLDSSCDPLDPGVVDPLEPDGAEEMNANPTSNVSFAFSTESDMIAPKQHISSNSNQKQTQTLATRAGTHNKTKEISNRTCEPRCEQQRSVRTRNKISKCKKIHSMLSNLSDMELAELSMPEFLQLAEATGTSNEVIQEMKIRRRKLKNRHSARGSAQKRRGQFRTLAAANKKLELEYKRLKRQSAELVQAHDQMVAHARLAQARATIETKEVHSLTRMVDHLRSTLGSQEGALEQQSL